MITFSTFKAFVDGFSWCLTLGKKDSEHVKGEIEDLLNHSSQSLKSLLELADIFPNLSLGKFNTQTFSRIANHCRLFFTSPQAAQQARTHCTDITRDVSRINFKMAKILRTEGGNWKGIDHAFRALLDADAGFLCQYEDELKRIGGNLDVIEGLLIKGDTGQAWKEYNTLRDSLLAGIRSLSNEIGLMQKAQTHIHALLT